MRLTLENAALSRLLKTARGVAAGDTAGLAVLRGVELQARGPQLFVRATDLNQECRLAVKAHVQEEGDALPAVGSLYELVASLGSGPTTLIRDGSMLRVENGATRCRLPLNFEDTLPLASEVEEVAGFETTSDWLARCLKAANGATLDDDGTYRSGVLLDLNPEGRVRITGCDNHRMSFREVGLEFGDYEVPEGGIQAVIPHSQVKNLLGLLPPEPEQTRVVFGRNRVAFDWADGRLSVVQLGGKYPDVDRILTKFPADGYSDCHLLVKPLQAALKRVRVVASGSERKNAVYFQFRDGGVRLSAWSPDLGIIHDDLEGRVEGSAHVRAVLSGEYVADALHSLGRESITLRLRNESEPARLQFDEREWLILMPMDWRDLPDA